MEERCGWRRTGDDPPGGDEASCTCRRGQDGVGIPADRAEVAGGPDEARDRIRQRGRLGPLDDEGVLVSALGAMVFVVGQTSRGPRVHLVQHIHDDHVQNDGDERAHLHVHVRGSACVLRILPCPFLRLNHSLPNVAKFFVLSKMFEKESSNLNLVVKVKILMYDCLKRQRPDIEPKLNQNS